MSDAPSVTISIPHWRGASILLRCLKGLRETCPESISVIVVDNGSDDGSVAVAKNEFPHIQVLCTGRNLGFAGACNHGLAEVKSKYAVLFNNDAVPSRNWLAPLIAAMESDGSIAACQPKLVSLDRPGNFDYAGAAGGFLDFLGYPFCRGRIFETIEQDHGQYDEPAEIFWASGACCMVRMEALSRVGVFDASFFSHMEEIDLNWRMHLAGYRIVAVPTSVVYHQAGTSLSAVSPFKTYLNHRNGLLILCKNYDRRLLWILPMRILLDLVAAGQRLFAWQWRHAVMIFRAHWYLAVNFGNILRARRQSRKIAAISDREMRRKLYHRSIVWQYFAAGKKRYSDLLRPN